MRSNRGVLVGGSRETLGEEIREGGDADPFSVVWTGRWRRSGGRAAGDAVSVYLRRAECVFVSVYVCVWQSVSKEAGNQRLLCADAVSSCSALQGDAGRQREVRDGRTRPDSVPHLQISARLPSASLLILSRYRSSSCACL